MATREELGQALTTLNDSVTDLVTDVQALIDKINAGGTVADFAAEVEKVQGSIDSLKNLDVKVEGELTE